MVRNAPPLKAVIQDLEAFIGSDPVLGHNVRFDLGFLQQQGILQLNEVIDTYELAAVLMPTAPRYNLGSLGQIMGILIENSHRALDDARLAHAVFMGLYDRALALPLELIAEIVRHSEPLSWDGAWLFQQILRARIRQPVQARQSRQTEFGALFQNLDEALGQPLMPNETLMPLNPDEIAALLEHGGPFSRYFEGFEHRPQQVEMLRAITQAFSEGYHLMVEAGTGTGKSYAYLVPAALWALQNNTRVVISTNTITLQDQLIKKDIPDLKAALNLDLRAAVLKGRANYLCPRRLAILRQRGPETPEQMRLLAKVLVWLHEGGQGDRAEINLNGPERLVWSSLSAEDEGCKAEVCLSRTGGACPFFLARQAANSAHVLIVNHALLLSDSVTGNRVLPEYNYLIVDEGHHIEDATTGALSYRVTQSDMERLLKELGGSSSGILGRVLTQLKALLRPSDFAGVHQAVERLTDLGFRADYDFKQFFQAVYGFLEAMREGQPMGTYSQQVRIIPATRNQPAWMDVEVAWDATHETLNLLLNLAGQFHKDISGLGEMMPEDLEDALGSLATAHRRLAEADGYLSSLASDPDESFIYWAELQPNGGRMALQIAPLHIGPLMEQYLWHEKASVILTSATLTTNGEFDYIRSRLNADEADELVVGSPFDYESSALLYLANDIPEPSDPSYQRAVEQAIVNLAKATGGRMLALFTSYAQLKRTSQAITPALAEQNIQVYEQGEGASANTLLETFRLSERAVLLGTRAFWEGVDIPGEALSVLVIVKLPFDVPSDPIVAARSETFEDPFSEYSIPEAILRFRQGFGRLIRTQSDRGVVAVLDRRLLTKRYGKMFIESLPECAKKVASLRDLPTTAARWLNL
jgi:DNA polymerase-3 subunit epsilon/ATP-dependent DNA helicase DinG